MTDPDQPLRNRDHLDPAHQTAPQAAFRRLVHRLPQRAPWEPRSHASGRG